MSLVVNTNINSSLVQRSLRGATSNIGLSIEKLSTGYKINKAADDAAGLTISEGLRSQARGADAAMGNAQSGINLLQTAESDLSIIQDNLQRIRDLAVQAANDTYGTAERTAITQEVQARVNEIDRLAKASSFNGISLLDGDGTTIQLLIDTTDTASLNTFNIDTTLTAATKADLNLDTITLDTASNASTFIKTVDNAISSVSKQRSTIGAYQNRLDSTIQSLSVKGENLSAAESRIRDTDIAKSSADLTKSQILQQASASLLAQANQAPSIALSLI